MCVYPLHLLHKLVEKKKKKSNLQDLWQKVSSHQSIYSKLWCFGVRSLRSRECGLYEASDLLLGDHLCGKSKTIKWVDVSQPHNRKRRLINHSRLVEMNEQNPNLTAIFEDNLIDTFYPQRPKHMEEVCLYDFVADYVKCGVDKDGNIVYRKLNKSVLPNHRVYNPILFYSSLSPFAMKRTSLRRERVPRMLSIGTWSKMMLSTFTQKSSREC